MHNSFWLILLLSLSACSVYKSPGRKFLEANISEYSNGIFSVTYSCRRNLLPEEEMTFVGEVEQSILAWSKGNIPDERWYLKADSLACRYQVSKREGDPTSTLVELLKNKLDESL